MGTVSKSSKWNFTNDNSEKLFAQNLMQINLKAQQATIAPKNLKTMKPSIA